METQHYVFIDTNSGYIFGDVHAPDCKTGAAIIDRSNRESDYQYAEVDTQDGSCYAVYTLATAHFYILPENYDGQDQNLIEMVEKFGQFETYLAGVLEDND